jgi:hypothetical protein
MSDTVVNLRGHMTMTEYDQERSKLAAERKYAGAHFDQQLAKLFYRSGWTQEQLATKEGISKSRADQRLERIPRRKDHQRHQARYPQELAQRQ